VLLKLISNTFAPRLMELANLSANLLSPLKAVDRHPVTVAPGSCLGDAIALMRGAIDPCPLPNSPPHSNETVKASISCVLVVDENQLVGLLSPEDVLNIATEYGFNSLKRIRIYRYFYRI
jgi:CBS domain-containing protein